MYHMATPWQATETTNTTLQEAKPNTNDLEALDFLQALMNKEDYNTITITTPSTKPTTQEPLFQDLQNLLITTSTNLMNLSIQTLSLVDQMGETLRKENIITNNINSVTCANLERFNGYLATSNLRKQHLENIRKELEYLNQIKTIEEFINITEETEII